MQDYKKGSKFTFDSFEVTKTNRKAYEKANRKAQLEVIHNWYQRNVKRYGFEYNFYPREDA